MRKLTIHFQARLDQERKAKAEDIMKRTGYNPSQLLRVLIDNAHVVTTPVINVAPLEKAALQEGVLHGG